MVIASMKPGMAWWSMVSELFAASMETILPTRWKRLAADDWDSCCAEPVGLLQAARTAAQIISRPRKAPARRRVTLGICRMTLFRLSIVGGCDLLYAVKPAKSAGEPEARPP